MGLWENIKYYVPWGVRCERIAREFPSRLVRRGARWVIFKSVKSHNRTESDSQGVGRDILNGENFYTMGSFKINGKIQLKPPRENVSVGSENGRVGVVKPRRPVGSQGFPHFLNFVQFFYLDGEHAIGTG